MSIIRLIILDEDGSPTFNPEVKMVACLRKIIDRDKGKVGNREVYETGDYDGRKKKLSTKELAFVYFFADPRASYIEDYRDDKIRTKVIKSVLDMPEGWKVDEVVQEAIDWYINEINQDFDVQLLDAGIHAGEQIKDYLRNVDCTQRDTKGGLVYDPKKVGDTIKGIGKLLEEIRSLRVKAFKSTIFNPTLRGGGNLGRFENPDDFKK